jgi:hypothetical protein
MGTRPARKAKRHPRRGMTAKVAISFRAHYDAALEELGDLAIAHGHLRMALRDLLAFYDRVAGTEGHGAKSGESWSTAEVLRLNEIRALVHPPEIQTIVDDPLCPR